MERQNHLFQLKTEFKKELQNILDYWNANTYDHQNGGFIGQITHNGIRVPESSKGAVLNARILWTFAAANRTFKSTQSLESANRAYIYLKNYFIDSKFGGLYWELDANGNPLNVRKQAYAQGFGLYAFSEYYRATGNDDSLKLAINLFELVEKHFYDRENGGYIEALDRDWNALEDMRLSEKDVNSPKSMNTHLHILEPYTNLYRVWPDERLKQRIIDLLRIFSEKIIDKNTGHFNLFFENDWTVKSNIVSFGHDIEGAWLLNEAAMEIGDKQLIKETKKHALTLVNVTMEDGMDADGSVFNEKHGTHLDTTKHWWMQAEALVGLMDAWQITGEDRYLITLEKVWHFIKTYVIDSENGEWFGHLNRNGNPLNTEDKVGFWKCPYHNSRAMLEMISRIELVLSKP